MKIHTLKLKNIHSIREETTIDFSGGILGDAGLFAITGPTGAGKSTLLDAIVLALYNRIPRHASAITKHVIEQEGVVLSKHAKDAYAELEYEVKGKRYRSSWSIARNKNENLNERRQEVSDATTGIILSEGTAVPDFNAKVIGLDYAQFVQSMVLAQGQFDKLLRSDRNTRFQLLEKLTGGQVYRSISQKVHHKHAELTKEGARLQTALGEVRPMTDEERDQKRTEQATLAAEQDAAAAQLQLLNSQIKIKENINNLHKRLQACSDALDVHAKTVEEARADREAMAQHEAALPLQGPLTAMEAAQKAFEGQQRSLEACLKQSDTVRQQQQDAQKEALALLRLPDNPTDVQAALTAFRQQFADAQLQETKLLQEYEVIQRDMQERAGRIRFVYPDFPQDDTAASQAEARLNDLTGKMAAWEVNTHDDLLRLREAHREKEQLASQLMGAHAQAEALQVDTVRLSEREQQIRGDQDRCAGDILIEDALLQDLRGRLEAVSAQLAERTLRQSLEAHRAHLVEGDPCPLCGATHHPLAGGDPDEGLAQLDGQVKQLSGQVEAARSRLHTLRERMQYLAADQRATADGLDKANRYYQQVLQTALTCCQALGWPVEGGMEDWQQRAEQLKQAGTDLDRLIAAIGIRSDLEGLVRQYPERHRARQAYEAARQQRASLYEGSDLAEVVDRHKSALQQASTQLQHLQQQQAMLQAQVQSTGEQFRQYQAALEQGLAQAGHSIASLRASLLPEGRVAALREHLKRLDDRRMQLLGEQNALKEQIAAEQQRDHSNLTLGDLQGQHQSAQTAQSARSERQGQLVQALRHDEELLERQRALIDQQDAVRNALLVWAPLNHLIGSSNGDRFVNLVQEITLRKLLGFANRRLQALQSRYQILSATDGALFIRDTRLGDSERSINTLSGGEMFTLSLAMALGLSDLASRNVVIESMFVDEGFGSLDPETLNDAIGVLEHIQATGNKSIGIISHVSELKERIGAKIRVEPNGNGSSSVSVRLD